MIETNLVRRTAADDIADMLRCWMRGGIMGPGDRLPAERELAVILGVGRITLRAALAELQAEGYLDVRRGARGGNFVTALDRPFRRWLNTMRRDLPGLHDLIDFRIGVERQLATLATRRATSDDLRQLTAAVVEMSEAGDAEGHRRAEHEFHQALAAAAGSDRMAHAAADARGEMFISMRPRSDREGRERSLHIHVELLRAIQLGDERAAADGLELELEEARARLVGLLTPVPKRR